MVAKEISDGLATIAIGANLGDALRTVRDTIRAFQADGRFGSVNASRLYRSAPLDASGADYVNAVVQLRTHLMPGELLYYLQSLETAAGRVRTAGAERNAPRTLDLDLLLYDNLEMTGRELTLPHPRMHHRAFVLVPLAELAPQLIVPGHGPVRELVRHVREQPIQVIEDTRCP